MFSLNAHDRIYFRNNVSFLLLNFIKHKSKNRNELKEVKLMIELDKSN